MLLKSLLTFCFIDYDKVIINSIFLYKLLMVTFLTLIYIVICWILIWKLVLSKNKIIKELIE